MIWRAFLALAIALVLFVWANTSSAQALEDRDMTLVEPTTTEAGFPLQNLENCSVDITDSTGLLDQRVFDASALTGGGQHTIDLAGKTGFTNVEAYCQNTLVEQSTKVSLSRTFLGDAPGVPGLLP